MLYARVNLTVREERTYSDRKIMLYRGDNNVDIEFNLTSIDYVVDNSKYVQAILTRPYAPSIFSELFALEDNKFILTITGDMIDELTELEMYSMQLILYDETQEDKVSLPPCYDIFDIKKPLATEAARINWAAVNYDTVAIDEEYTDDTIFEGNEYIQTNWRDGDIISDTRLNKIETAIAVVAHKAGNGSGGTTSAKLSSSDPEVLVLNAGHDLELNISFVAESTGRGILYVTIDNMDKYSTSIPQGGSRVSIPENIFTKGVNVMSIYAIDRNGNVSNKILFEVRYGSLELKSSFDYDVAYDHQSVIRFYYTPTVADTSLELTFHMLIDGTERAGMTCTSDIRNYFEFPTDLSAGRHYCEAFISDPNGTTSNTIRFYLVLLTNDNLVVTSNTRDVVVEEGSQLVIDYKIYMKNENSFKNKIYVDDNLVNTGTCGLERNYYKTTSLTEGDHSIRIEVTNQSGTKSDSITFGVTVTPSTYTMITETNAGLLFSGTAFNKTNSDQNKEVWIGKDQYGNPVQGTLVNFAFNNESGWVDDSLKISGSSHVEIPIKPLSDNARTGFTLDIEFLSKQIGVDNAEVLNIWDDNKNCGLKITTESIMLRSASGNKCDLYFTDNEFTNVIFVIDRNELTAKIYLNGVMCSAFHLSDYMSNGVAYLEDFTVDKNIIIGGQSKNGYCEIKNIRVYEVALTTDEILNNFMANERDKSKQQSLFEFQKGNTLPTLTIYGDFSGLGKNDKKPCKIIYNSTDEAKYGKSFVLDHKQSLLQYQGTSSMAYPIKNYRLNLRDEEGNKLYYAFPNGKPECRFTLKADFMSSGHWQNTGFTKWVNDNLYNYDTSNPKSMNPKKWFDIHNGGSIKDTRECIYGFPCRLILVNDGTSPLNEGQNEPTPGNTKDMGIFNFNHDKDCADTIGFDQVNFPNCASFEIAANSDTSAGAFMSYSTVNPEGLSELEYLKQSFELRFPDEDDVTAEWGFMGVEGEDGSGIKALVDWVDKSSDEEFVRDFEQHFHKDYTLRYYLIVMVCGMVDNLGKNMMLDTWDNKIWMPRFYDCDTICSYDNSGDIKFDVDIEMEQGYWNTSSSRLWTRIRDLMHDDLVAKYNDMRKNGLSYESLMRCFYDEQIAKIPQKYYNMDFDVKYAPFGDSYLGMAHGDGYQHLKRWLKKRLIFCDTLFDYAPSYNNDVLTIRANTTEEMTIEIETYTPLYQHVSWYNGQMDKKKIDGKISVTFNGTAMAATDQEVLIYGGSNIKKITGLQSMNPNQMLIGYATKLSEIDASNCSILADINSSGANLSPHIYLNKVNLANCSDLSGNLRLDNSQLIREVDISGTAISGIQLPTSLRNLETLKLSEDVRSLTLRDANLLRELNLPANIEYLNLINVPKLKTLSSSSSSLDKLHTLIMENPTINPISNITSKAPNLKHVRLIGLDIGCSTSQIESLLNMKGVDSFGNEIPIAQAVSGKVALSECSTDIEQQLRNTFPLVEFTVTNYVTSFSVTFVDGDGNTLYTTRVIQNGEAVYIGDTPTKTATAQYSYEFSGWDRQLKPIISDCTINAVFKATLKYYTIRFINSDTQEVILERVLGYGATISKPELPTGANMWSPVVNNVTGDQDFYSKYVPYPEDLSIFNFSLVTIDDVSCYEVDFYASAAVFPSFLILPFEYNGKPVVRFKGTDNNTSRFSTITSVYVPETIEELGDYAFYGFSSITELILPESVRRIKTSSRSVISSCSKLQKIVAPGITTIPIAYGTSYAHFRNCPRLETVILGSEKYPFTSWAENDSVSRRMHFAGSMSKLKYVNLVTENGLKTDVRFNYTPSVDSYIVCTTSPIEEYTDDLGFTYAIAGKSATITKYTGGDTELEIPTTVKGATVTGIGDSVFYGNTGLTKLIAPSITRLGNGCFNGCGNLTSIEIPEVTSFGTYCFGSCTSLTSVELPKATSLPGYCFNNCSALTSVNAPLVTSLGSNCFNGCSNLTSMELPLATSLGYQCFYNCNALTSVNLPNVTELGSNCFYSCSALTSIELPLATTLENYCFKNCNRLKSVDLPEAITLEIECFNGCYNLTSVDLPKATSLGNGCFNGCSNLTSIEIPEVTSLGDSCFNGCRKLTSVDLPKATSLPDYCFNNCSALTSANAPLVTSLGSSCFYYCSNLTSMELPLATSLDRDCFNGCSKLTSIEIPNVTSLGSICFCSCSALTSIELPNVTSLGDSCFYYANVDILNLPSINTIGTRVIGLTTKTITLGGSGKPVDNTISITSSSFNTSDRFQGTTSYPVENIYIYVSDPNNPPTISNQPWGATSATITYLQA